MQLALSKSFLVGILFTILSVEVFVTALFLVILFTSFLFIGKSGLYEFYKEFFKSL